MLKYKKLYLHIDHSSNESYSRHDGKCIIQQILQIISVFPKGFQVTSAKMADVKIFYVCHFHFMPVKLKKKKNVTDIHIIFLPIF